MGLSVREIRDPVHGYIKVNEVEQSVIDTPIFQRLRRIKQLGSAYMVYPGAEHSRFSHSVGVMHVTGLICERLKSRGHMNDEEAQIVKLAALLHDLGHGPFSHLFEEIVFEARKQTHEDITRWLVATSEVADVLSSHGYDPKLIADLAVGRARGNFARFNAIIAGHYCGDTLDYLVRDAHFSGVEYGKIDIHRIINSMDYVDDVLSVDVNALYAVESYVIARYEMFKAVYFHKTVRASAIMLVESIREANKSLGFTDFKSSEEYLTLTDDYIVNEIMKLKSSDAKHERRAYELMKSLLSRRLIKVAYEKMLHSRDTLFNVLFSRELQREIINILSEKSGVSSDQIYLDAPTMVSVPQYPRMGPIQLHATNSRGKKVKMDASELSPLIPSLTGYLNLIRIYTKEEFRDRVSSASTSFFGEPFYGHTISY